MPRSTRDPVLRDLPVEGTAGESLIAPVKIDGLPEEIFALERLWHRKTEFHLTAVGVPLIEAAGVTWELAARVAIGRRMGPIYVTPEVRRVRDPDRPDLETIVLMVRCPVFGRLYAELSEVAGVELRPPPAHVTVYSTDAERGIGINDEEQLCERAPALSDEDQADVRAAMRFESIFGGES